MSESFEFIVDEIVDGRESCTVQLFLLDKDSACETEQIFLSFKDRESAHEYKTGLPVKVSIRQYSVLELTDFNMRGKLD
jgi:hypothetical protein